MKKFAIAIGIGLIFLASIFFAKSKSGKVAPNTSASTLDQSFQIWSLHFSGKNQMDLCKGEFKVEGDIDIVIPATFSQQLANPPTTPSDSNLKTEALVSITESAPDDSGDRIGVYPISSRGVLVPSIASVTWSSSAEKKSLRIAVSSAGGAEKPLVDLQCKIKDKFHSSRIFTIVFSGNPTGQGFAGDWKTDNANSPEEHSLGDFKMELVAGLNTTKSIAPSGLQLIFGGDDTVLSWKPVPGAEKYIVYVSQGPTLDRATAVKMPLADTTAHISGVKKHLIYNFAVSAILGNSESALSPSVLGVLGDTLVATKIAAGDRHACAIVAGGEVICWGANESAQLGNANFSKYGIAVPVPGVTTAVDISAGANFSCALLADGKAKCWGSNDKGELGIGVHPGAYGPSGVGGVSSGSAIESQGHRTCATLKDGAVHCWGEAVPNAPTGPIPPLKELALSKTLACGLTRTNEILCWDAKGSKISKLASRVKNLAANDNIVCAVQDDHKSRCFEGLNGSPSENDLARPARDLKNLERLWLNEEFACGVKVGGSISCWGRNTHAQLGVDWPLATRRPFSSQMTIKNVDRGLALGTDFACALTAEGSVYCWGSNEFGQLGNGIGKDSARPLIVLK